MLTLRLNTFVVVLLLIALTCSAWAGEAVVVSSTSPHLYPGQIIMPEDPLQITAGKQVTLVAESGKTLTIVGPHASPSGISEKPEEHESKFLGALRDLFFGSGRYQDLGGIVSYSPGGPSLVRALAELLSGSSANDMETLGVARAGGRRESPDDPWAIDIGSSGDRCAAADGPVTFWRAAKNEAQVLSLKNLVNRSQTLADWPAGAGTLGWPKEVGLADGAHYLLSLRPFGATRKLALHLVPGDLPTDAHKAAWMAERGCADQARRLLARLR